MALAVLCSYCSRLTSVESALPADYSVVVLEDADSNEISATDLLCFPDLLLHSGQVFENLFDGTFFRF